MLNLVALFCWFLLMMFFLTMFKWIAATGYGRWCHNLNMFNEGYFYSRNGMLEDVKFCRWLGIDVTTGSCWFFDQYISTYMFVKKWIG